MQDNAPCHASKATRAWLEGQNLKILNWPAQSPDLNPIEHVWAIMKFQVSKGNPKNIAELDEIANDVRSKLDPQYLNNLVESMPRRIRAVIEARGYQTKY